VNTKTAPHEVAIADGILTATWAAIDALRKATESGREDVADRFVADGFRIAARMEFDRIRSLALTASRSLKKRNHD
jgi:hypothetical protein